MIDFLFFPHVRKSKARTDTFSLKAQPACPLFFGLIVIPAGQDPDRVLFNFIDQPVFLIDTTRPAAGKLILERLRFAGSLGRGALNFFDQLNDTKGFFAILLYPPA
jgi:hypothetical protein